MFNKLKLKLKEWLFKDELDQLRVLSNDYKFLHQSTSASLSLLYRAREEYLDAEKELYETNKVCRDLQKTINDVCDVGVDVGLYEEYHNWAVICIHGKTEFVKFIPIAQKDIYTIRDFLKQFECCDHRKMHIDSPFGYREVCEPWCSKHRYE